MKITDVEAIVLRQAVVNEGIADGSQDDLVVRIHTDEGITGIGEVDSSPELVQALVQAPSSHAVAVSLRDVLIGEDPMDVERLWHKMYRGLIYFGRRGIAIHAISGLDIALWDIKGKALGKPVCELLGTPQRDRVRAYASMLMPDTTEEVTEAPKGGEKAGAQVIDLMAALKQSLESKPARRKESGTRSRAANDEDHAKPASKRTRAATKTRAHGTARKRA